MAVEDLATERQIRKLYAVLHNHGIDPREFKTQRNIASYSKLTVSECSALIDEFTETGDNAGEEEERAHDVRSEEDPETEIARLHRIFDIAKEVITQNFGDLHLSDAELGELRLRLGISLLINEERRCTM